MSKLAIAYHSAHGHTEFIARQVQAGTSQVAGIEAHLVKAEDIGTAVCPATRRPIDWARGRASLDRVLVPA